RGMTVAPLLSLRTLLASLLLAAVTPRHAHAQANTPTHPAVLDPPLARHIVEGHLETSNFDVVAGQVGYRYAFASRWQLGLYFGTALSREAYFAGYAADRAISTVAGARLIMPVFARGPMLVQLRMGSGVRIAWSLDDELLAHGAPGDRVTAITGDLGLRANVAAGSRVVLS